MHVRTLPETRIILVVATDPALTEDVGHIIERAGWHSIMVGNVATAIAKLTSREGKRLSAIVLDHGTLPSDSAESSILELRQARAPTPIILLSATNVGEAALAALRAGASDIVIKPIGAGSLMRSIRLNSSAATPVALKPMAAAPAAESEFNAMIGAAPAFRTAVARAAMAARGSGNLLIQGEAGTGKGMLMRAAQAASSRGKLPFKILNVRSVTASELDSALFGQMSGTMSGPWERTAGVLEQCDGGIVGLDEVNRLSLDVQERLADALISQRIQPVGAQYGLHLDVRVIAASNQPLAESVEEGGFSRRLYEVISGTTITLPPLRHRLEDIPALVRHFVSDAREQFGLAEIGVTDDALFLLAKYPWLENVRQLQGTLIRAAALCRGDALACTDFPDLAGTIQDDRPRGQRHSEQAGIVLYAEDGHLRPLQAIQDDVVRLAIGRYQGRMTEVARRLHIGRSTLYRRLDELGLASGIPR